MLVASVASPVDARPAFSPNEAVRGTLGVVTAESPLAAEAGLEMLRQGGNAVDAAVAAAFAVGVVRYDMCGIGGGGFLVYRGADGTTDTLDFMERAPGKGGSYTDRPGMGVQQAPNTSDVPAATRGITYLPDTGRGRIGVPGFVKGAEAALARYGTKSLAQALERAARYAEEGFPVSPLSRYLAGEEYAHALLFPGTYQTYYQGVGVPGNALRRPYEPGETLRLPEYAATLRRIAEHGSAEMYDVAGGRRTATELLSAMQAPAPTSHVGDASDMTAEDLQSYQVHWRKPVKTNYRGHEIIGMGGPSSGGTVIAEALNILEGFDLPAMDARSDRRLHLTVEAQRIAWTDRLAYYGDPGPPGQRSEPGDHWADVPRELTSKHYADQRRAEIGEVRVPAYAPGSFADHRPETGSGGTHERNYTTAVSVIDGAGNAAVLNCSLGLPLGSLVTVPGLGFLLNCSLGVWGPPGSPNAPAAGKATLSAQAPTIVVRDGHPVLAVGGQGGRTITTGVLNVVLQTIDHRDSTAEAMDAPRISCCTHGKDESNGPVYVEERPGMQQALDALAARGHALVREQGYWVQPVLQAAGSEPGSVEPLLSSSDPRGECGPSSVERGVTSSRCYHKAKAGWLASWAPSDGG